jgi:hypothetical protein
VTVYMQGYMYDHSQLAETSTKARNCIIQKYWERLLNQKLYDKEHYTFWNTVGFSNFQKKSMKKSQKLWSKREIHVMRTYLTIFLLYILTQNKWIFIIFNHDMVNYKYLINSELTDDWLLTKLIEILS